MKHFKYFDLIKELSTTDFKLKYEGSLLGYVWSLGRPLLLFLIYYVIFAYVFNIGKGVPNYPLYLLIGIVLWQFFAETTSICMTSIQSNSTLIRKVYFPRIILPISTSITAIITLVLNFLVVLGFVLYGHVFPNPDWLLLPILVFELYLLTLGVSLFLAAIFVKFKDIGVLWGVIVQALFYGTPIIYSLSMVPERFQKLVMLNPASQIILDARWVILKGTLQNTQEILGIYAVIPPLIAISIFAFGYLIFDRMASRFAEEV